MKKKVLDLVNEYREKENRIHDIETALHEKKLEDANITVFNENGEDPITSEINFEKGEQLNRVRDFLKRELQIERENLKKIDQQIIQQFRE